MEHPTYKKHPRSAIGKGRFHWRRQFLDALTKEVFPSNLAWWRKPPTAERNAPLQGYDSKVYRKGQEEGQQEGHKEKAALFLTSAGVQFSMEEQTNSFLSYKIAEEKEFINTKKHRPSQAHYLRARCGACARRCFNYVALYQKLFLRAIISCLEHIQVKHKDMSEEILKKIPAVMAEPMMIFKSHTVSNRIVLVLDLKDNQGVDIIVPLELEAVKGREKHILSHRDLWARLWKREDKKYISCMVYQ